MGTLNNFKLFRENENLPISEFLHKLNAVKTVLPLKAQ